MEVTLAAHGGLTPPADTFVSLRIGQVQRHARFATTRVYRFPEEKLDPKACGRVEVFKRLGATTVCLGSSCGDVQDIEVPCNDPNFSKLRMRVTATDCLATGDQTPSKVQKKSTTRVNSARRYLADHQLEDVLKEAMKEVMSQKPTDPHDFLAQFILRHPSRRLNLPPLSPARIKQEDNLFPPITEKKPMLYQDALEFKETSAAKSLPPPSTPTQRPRNLPPIEKTSATMITYSKSTPALSQPVAQKSAPPPVEQMEKSATVFVELPEKSSPPPPVEVEAEEAPVEEPTSPQTWMQSPSVGTWCAARLTRSLAEAAEEPMPTTELTEPVPAGSKVLPVAASGGFTVGDPIYIESAVGSETNALKGFGSLKLLYPTKFAYPPGTTISKLPADDDRVKALPEDFLAKAQEEAAAEAPKKDEAEELRQQAKQTLLEATSSGKLDEALANLKKPKPQDEAEDLRQQAKATLLEATSSGKLDEALANLKGKKEPEEVCTKGPIEETEDLRKQVKDTLLDAVATGKMDEALAAVKGEPTSSSSKTDDIRETAKKTLLEATLDGRLESTLMQMRPKVDDEGEKLRMDAKKTLMEAATDGRLEEGLAKLRGSQETTVKDTEAVRERLKKTLLDSAADGRLASALEEHKGAAPGASGEAEDMRQLAKKILLEASDAGTLETALAQISKPAEEPLSETEQVRMQARETLEKAVTSGSLDAALANIKQTKEASDVKELRLQAQSALLQATVDGSLAAALMSTPAKQAEEPPPPPAAEPKPAEAAAEEDVAKSAPPPPPPPVAEEKPVEMEVEDDVAKSAPPPAEPPAEEGLKQVPEAVREQQQAVEKPGTPSTPGIPVDQLQEQIVAGLKDQIGNSVKNAVGDAVKSAFSELKVEMKKREEQSAKLSNQMSELTSAVKSLQEEAGQ
mmetsp:Transcript_156775/g.300708  ORF Transcript_156775/g.300708 Transcript_156775/m.300708 type:complete len:915 (+) Transcript_156775:102-2846(+)